jgi:hypothetical protein
MASAASAPAAAAASRSAAQYLAYEYAIEAQAKADEIKPLYDRLVAACMADAANACVQMESSLGTGEFPGARLKFRLKAAGVAPLTALLEKGGKVISQSTRVEDLADPITDNARRIALLQGYEQSLLALEKKPGMDVDNLIKVSKELANTQSDLEALTGTNAHLMERVNLRMLTINIDTHSGPVRWSPIGNAMGNAVNNMASALGLLITVVSYLLPWMLVLVPGWFLVRKAFRKKE